MRLVLQKVTSDDKMNVMKYSIFCSFVKGAKAKWKVHLKCYLLLPLLLSGAFICEWFDSFLFPCFILHIVLEWMGVIEMCLV